MGKVASIAAALVLLLAAVLIPIRHTTVGAQSPPPVSCSGQPLATPMQGHYTGQWHSEGDYHFYALGHDIDLKLTIDGTIDAEISGGQITGTLTGNVDAPLTHEGQQDVSSGKGTISGQLTGLFDASGGLAVLAAPVILMHWGTFVGGGYTADRYITMPNYQFSIGATNCVSAHGAIAETNFPEQYIVADFQGQLAYVPGIGQATGTWQISSDSSAEFQALSQQVDAFITQSNTFLAGLQGNLTPALVESNVAAPLTSLEATIRKDPTVARCLLDRLGAWEASVLQPLLVQVVSLASSSDLPTFRRGSNVLRSVHLLDLDCALDEGTASSGLMTAGRAALDHTVGSRSWSDAAVWIRELLLQGGDAGRTALQQQVGADLHALLLTTSGAATLLEVARASYLFGDPADSMAALKRASARPHLTGHALPDKRKKRKKKKATPRPAPTRTPTRTPTPTPTPTPTSAPPPPQTLEQRLSSGTGHLQVSSTGGAAPTLSWTPMPGAARYVVAVAATDSSGLVWTWSGGTTSVAFGDTSLPGVTGSGDDAWGISLGDIQSTWSVLALDSAGHIVGANFGAKL
jgi:hypothetical protein